MKSNPDRALATEGSRLAAWLPWLLGGCFVIVLALRDLMSIDQGVIGGAAYWGRDFINVWTGGNLLLADRPDVIYDLAAYPEYQRGLFGDIDPHYYSYPPITFPLATLFAALPYPFALALWLGGTGALFVVAARPWWPDRAGWPVLALLTPAALVNIWAGHYGFLVGALFLFGWRRIDDRPILAGVFFGLMLIKPHLAVLVPLVLILRGDWRVIASGAITVVALIGLTLLLYGADPWAEYLTRTSAMQASLIDAQGMFFRLMTPSLAASAIMLGASWPVALGLQAVLATGGIGMVVIATLRRVPLDRIALLAASCTFLVLPYSFNYDMTVVMIGALALMIRIDLSEGERKLAMLGFVAPQLGMVLAGFHMPLMWLMLLGVAIVQFRVALRDTASLTRAPAAPAALTSAR